MSVANRNKISDSCAPCATLSQSPSNYCFDGSNSTNTSSSSLANSSINSTNNLGRGGGGGGNNAVPTGFISPRERLEAFSADFDILKPLLMYNIESIQTFRADCKYKKAR